MTENHHHHHHQQQQQRRRRRRRNDDNDDVHQFTEIYTRHISLPARCMPPMKIITQYPRFVRLRENNFLPLRYSLLFYSPT